MFDLSIIYVYPLFFHMYIHIMLPESLRTWSAKELPQIKKKIWHFFFFFFFWWNAFMKFPLRCKQKFGMGNLTGWSVFLNSLNLLCIVLIYISIRKMSWRNKLVFFPLSYISIYVMFLWCFLMEFNDWQEWTDCLT